MSVCVCVFVCARAHLFVCRETRGVFLKCSVHMPVHACKVLGWQWVSGCSSKKLRLFVSFFSHPRAQTIPLRFVSDDLWVCICVNLHDDLMMCDFFLPASLQDYWPPCTLFSFFLCAVSHPIDSLSLHRASQLSFQLDFTGFTVCDVPDRYSAGAPSRSCRPPPLCAFDISGHFEVVRAPLKHSSLFLFLSGQTDTTIWWCVEDLAVGERWHRTDVEKLVMRLRKPQVTTVCTHWSLVAAKNLIVYWTARFVYKQH